MDDEFIVRLIAITFIVIIIIFILIKFICFREKTIGYLESIKELKSKIQILKTKGNQAIKKMNQVVDMNTNSADKLAAHNHLIISGFNYSPSGVNLDINDLSEHSNYTGASFARELSAARLELNSLIKEYNLYIKRLLNVPFAAILKYKEVDYIDESNLDESVRLEDKDW